MDNHCITCKFCDHAEGHVCTLGRLPIDDPYSDSCGSYEAKPNTTEVDLALEPKELIVLCPDCQNSVNYDDMIWLDGRCTCPSCYIKRRAQMDPRESSL